MQWAQIESGTLNAHHPILHTLFQAICIKIGLHVFGSFNAGVAIEVLTQELILLTIFAAIVYTLFKCGMSKKLFIFVMIYFALDPIVGMFIFSTTKDVIFSALFSLYVVHLYFFISHAQQLGAKMVLAILLGAELCLCAVLRTNALIGFIIIIPVVSLLAAKDMRKLYLKSSLIGFALAIVFIGPFQNVIGVESSPIGKWNSLCVFDQQIARCAYDDSVGADDKKQIEQLLPGITYKDNLADVSRNAFMNHEGTAVELVKLYLFMGLKYPHVYLDAFFYQTQDAWSPFAVIDCYTGNTDGRTDVFSCGHQAPASSESLLPQLLSFLQWISGESGIEKIPVIGLIVSISFYIFVELAALVLLLKRHDKTGLAALAPLLVLTLTNLFGPCMLIRYFLYLLFSLPFLMFLIVGPQNLTNSARYNTACIKMGARLLKDEDSICPQSETIGRHENQS